MLVPFHDLKSEDKIWIFQNEITLDPKTEQKISSDIEQFINSWSSHNETVYAGYQILYGHFLILGAKLKLGHPSGCSIDKLTHLMREIDQKYDLDFLKATGLLAYSNAKNNIQFVPFAKIKDAINKGIINLETLIFDNSLTNLGQFTETWQLKAKYSWLKKQLPVEKVS